MELNNFHDIDPLKSQPGEILQNSNEESLSVKLSKMNFKSSFLLFKNKTKSFIFKFKLSQVSFQCS